MRERLVSGTASSRSAWWRGDGEKVGSRNMLSVVVGKAEPWCEGKKHAQWFWVPVSANQSRQELAQRRTDGDRRLCRFSRVSTTGW